MSSKYIETFAKIGRSDVEMFQIVYRQIVSSPFRMFLKSSILLLKIFYFDT